MGSAPFFGLSSWSLKLYAYAHIVFGLYSMQSWIWTGSKIQTMRLRNIFEFVASIQRRPSFFSVFHSVHFLRPFFHVAELSQMISFKLPNLFFGLKLFFKFPGESVREIESSQNKVWDQSQIPWMWWICVNKSKGGIHLHTMRNIKHTSNGIRLHKPRMATPSLHYTTPRKSFRNKL